MPDDVRTAATRKPGEYVVVARRYRPASFQELVGQNQVSQALGNAITTNRVGHAYLFTGARGVGKTSAARIFAKALNCQRGPTPTPCNECDICLGIATGEDLDVLEIDGASNRGIDEIRQLRSNVNIRPSRARFKIYIIDEVHMLTLPAFNALLKTLEEPPEHVKFIFATTDPEKIPITILSRCQRYDFPPVEVKSITDRLRFIVANEGVAADDEALHLLARRANGSMRDSQSLLEQLLSFCPQRITVNDVHAMLGTARGGQLSALVEKLVTRDGAGALQKLNEALSEGVEAGQLVEQLVGYFRDMMAALVGCDAEMLLHTMAADHAQLQATGRQLGLETILAIVQILDQAFARMRQSTHSRTLLEVAIIRICQLENLDELSELIAEMKHAGVAPVSIRSSVSPRTLPEKKNDVTPAPSTAPNRQPAMLPPPVAMSEGARSASTESNSIGADPSAQIELSPTQVDALWKEALTSLGDMTAEFARHAESVSLTGPNRLVARFRAEYTLNKDSCERPERKSRLENALSQAAGRTIRLDLEVASAAAETEARPMPVLTRGQRMQETQRHPLVRKAIELFDGEVLRTDQPRKRADDRS